MTKQIIIKEDTDELLQKLRIGDESYNSIIWRNLKKKENAKERKNKS